MFSAVSVLALLVSASVLNAQSNPIVQILNATQTLINAAQPFGCEATEFVGAVQAAVNFENAAAQFLANPTAAGQAGITNVINYAQLLLSWPLCWAAEAGRVAAAAAGLINSGFFN